MKYYFKVTAWEKVEVPDEYDILVFDKIKSGEIRTSNELTEALPEGSASVELLYDTFETMSVEENMGHATVVVNFDQDSLYVNGII